MPSSIFVVALVKVPKGFFQDYQDITIQYVVLGPRKSPMPLVPVFSENDKIFRQEKKYVE